jgi:hypothetical protein
LLGAEGLSDHHHRYDRGITPACTGAADSGSGSTAASTAAAAAAAAAAALQDDVGGLLSSMDEHLLAPLQMGHLQGGDAHHHHHHHPLLGSQGCALGMGLGMGLGLLHCSSSGGGDGGVGAGGAMEEGEEVLGALGVDDLCAGGLVDGIYCGGGGAPLTHTSHGMVDHTSLHGVPGVWAQQQQGPQQHVAYASAFGQHQHQLHLQLQQPLQQQHAVAASPSPSSDQSSCEQQAPGGCDATPMGGE